MSVLKGQYTVFVQCIFYHTMHVVKQTTIGKVGRLGCNFPSIFALELQMANVFIEK